MSAEEFDRIVDPVSIVGPFWWRTKSLLSNLGLADYSVQVGDR
jgi:hypothetical protein